MMCNRLANNAHLQSHVHRDNAGGTQLGFDFPDREILCAKGVAFRQHNGAALDTTPFLPADHLLPSGGGADVASQVDTRRAQSIQITQVFGGLAPRSGMDRRFTCQVDWGRGTIETMTFLYLASGRERDAFAEATLPYIMKIHKVMHNSANANADEWEAYTTLPQLRSVLPTVHGYFDFDLPCCSPSV